MKITAVIISSQHKNEGILTSLFSAAREIATDASLSAWYLCDDGQIPLKYNVGQVFVFRIKESGIYSAESLLPILVRLYDENTPDVMLFPADSVGRELAVRLTERINVPCITDIYGFSTDATNRFVLKQSYNAALVSKYKYKTPIIFTVITSIFESNDTAIVDKDNSENTYQELYAEDVSSIYGHAEILPTESFPDIGNTKRVIAIGQGIGTIENAEIAAAFSEMINGMIGGSRPAIINGWVPFSRQIGMSGNIIHPEICIVLGASGARAFAIGIKDSKFIIGVNTDENAALFNICDIGAVCDASDFLVSLIDLFCLEIDCND